MKNTTINIGVIKKIATALQNLNERFVYVGGAVVSLYVNDPQADDVRPTKDIDISLEIASLAELEQLREELLKKGFKQSHEDNVICRFRYDDIKVDVMSTKAIGWAPANVWFAPGFKHLQKVQLDKQSINILPLSYFLATKFEAFHGRGEKEPRMSHDLEDVIYIMDNRTDLVEVIKRSPDDVRNYLIKEFTSILNSAVLREAIQGNLYYETQDIRFKKLITKLEEIVKA
jgi:predicted nucleotidyltransferase